MYENYYDDVFTPFYAVTPILKHIPATSKIWCPFDTDDSAFVQEFRAAGHTVAATSIPLADIPNDTLRRADFIVGKPAHSQKSEVLARLFEVGVPFAMLVGVVSLFETQKRFEMFRDHKFEIMYLNQRVIFKATSDEEKPSVSPPFASAYVCSGVLPSQIVFEEVNRK